MCIGSLWVVVAFGLLAEHAPVVVSRQHGVVVRPAISLIEDKGVAVDHAVLVLAINQPHRAP